MAAAMQATTSASVAAVSSCFVASDSGRQLCSPPSVSFAGFGWQFPTVRCGRGDKRTAKGKRFKGSFGNARPKHKSKGRGLLATPLPPRPPKKDVDDDYIQVDLDESLFSS